MSERLKLLNFKVTPNSKSFGMVLNEDRADCVVGAEAQTMDGLFKITNRRWDGKELHLSFERVRSNRKWRRQEKARARALSIRK